MMLCSLVGYQYVKKLNAVVSKLWGVEVPTFESQITTKKVENGKKRYSDQLLGMCSTQKLVEIQNNNKNQPSILYFKYKGIFSE